MKKLTVDELKDLVQPFRCHDGVDEEGLVVALNDWFEANHEFSFADYERAMNPTAVYPNLGNNFVYTTIGAVGEGGELMQKLGLLAEKVKKLWRDHGLMGQGGMHNVNISPERLDEIVKLREGCLKETGDVLWYLMRHAQELGSTLAQVARENADKILDRQRRGVLNGSGDNR